MSASTSEVQQLIDRFGEQSPIVRWGLGLAAAIVLYLVWSGLIAPTARDWGARAAMIEHQIEEVRERDGMAAEVRRMRETIVALGPVSTPMPITDGQSYLESAVNAVKNEYRMSNDSLAVTPRGALPRGSLHGLEVGGQPTLLTGQLRFDAAPDEAIAIIAALEARPEIARVNEAFIHRIGNRRVNVRLTIESWVLTTEPSRPGRV